MTGHKNKTHPSVASSRWRTCWARVAAVGAYQEPEEACAAAGIWTPATFVLPPLGTSPFCKEQAHTSNTPNRYYNNLHLLYAWATPQFEIETPHTTTTQHSSTHTLARANIISLHSLNSPPPLPQGEWFFKRQTFLFSSISASVNNNPRELISAYANIAFTF